MKPAKFDYYDPRSLEEGLALLEAHQSDAKVLAGGQSLMPLLNMRLARPKVVVDINRISSLNYVRTSAEALAIGANARQRALLSEKLIAERVPILREAGNYIAHPQIRSRGTICGSIAHADPAAELPAVALALDAQMTLTSAKATRTVAAEDFFLSYFTTAIEPNEMLSEVRFPVPSKDTAWSVLEVSRRHGDFALVGIVAGLTLDANRQTIAGARLVYFGVGATPVRVKAAEQALIGQPAGDAAFDAAAQSAKQGIDPSNDIHASEAYRRAVAATLTKRALRAALQKLGKNEWQLPELSK
jgi:CO/xanthine dehydrogenase FAD-binding subunit